MVIFGGNCEVNSHLPVVVPLHIRTCVCIYIPHWIGNDRPLNAQTCAHLAYIHSGISSVRECCSNVQSLTSVQPLILILQPSTSTSEPVQNLRSTPKIETSTPIPEPLWVLGLNTQASTSQLSSAGIQEHVVPQSETDQMTHGLSAERYQKIYHSVVDIGWSMFKPRRNNENGKFICSIWVDRTWLITLSLINHNSELCFIAN